MDALLRIQGTYAIRVVVIMLESIELLAEAASRMCEFLSM